LKKWLKVKKKLQIAEQAAKNSFASYQSDRASKYLRFGSGGSSIKPEGYSDTTSNVQRGVDAGTIDPPANIIFFLKGSLTYSRRNGIITSPITYFI
jgi:hypothetical protein